MTSNETIATVFGVPRALIGMVHVQPLPGTPRASLSVDEICGRALAEARQLAEAGFHGVMIENMHDRPYLKRKVGPEVVATMAVVGRTLEQGVGLPLGLQILGGANHDALAAALGAGADFVRTEGFAFGHIADEGWMESDAGPLLRYRRVLGAESIQIFVDIKKKHASHAITDDIDLVETARAAEFFLADGVIVTGSATGRAADPEEVEKVAAATTIPTLVGSGVTPENVSRFGAAQGLIVGSVLKRDGLWSNAMEPRRLERMVEAFERAG